MQGTNLESRSSLAGDSVPKIPAALPTRYRQSGLGGAASWSGAPSRKEEAEHDIQINPNRRPNLVFYCALPSCSPFLKRFNLQKRRRPKRAARERLSKSWRQLT